MQYRHFAGAGDVASRWRTMSVVALQLYAYAARTFGERLGESSPSGLVACVPDEYSWQFTRAGNDFLLFVLYPFTHIGGTSAGEADDGLGCLTATSWASRGAAFTSGSTRTPVQFFRALARFSASGPSSAVNHRALGHTELEPGRGDLGASLFIERPFFGIGRHHHERRVLHRPDRRKAAPPPRSNPCQ